MPTARDLPHRLTGEELLITDPDTGQVHFLNATAALVWECCDGKSSLADCGRRLSAEFDIPAGVDVMADVREIVGQLRGLRLLEG